MPRTLGFVHVEVVLCSLKGLSTKPAITPRRRWWSSSVKYEYSFDVHDTLPPSGSFPSTANAANKAKAICTIRDKLFDEPSLGCNCSFHNRQYSFVKTITEPRAHQRRSYQDVVCGLSNSPVLLLCAKSPIRSVHSSVFVYAAYLKLTTPSQFD